MWEAVVKELETKMDKTHHALNQELVAVRTGRASPAMLDNVKVLYYGTPTPLKQLANVAVPEPRLLVIQPWDAGTVKEIEKAILASDLGLKPLVEGKVIRIPIPSLSKERREEMTKIVKKMAEDSRVALRTLRRDFNERIKQLEKDKKITEDDRKVAMDKIQHMTDRFIARVDETASAKEKEILTV